MVLEGLPDHIAAPSDRLMRLRWVLAWKSIWQNQEAGRPRRGSWCSDSRTLTSPPRSPTLLQLRARLDRYFFKRPPI